RYQAHELTLDEMTEENSVYVEESKLKDRFMKIFNKVCALKKVNSATGRAIERKITVASCRFPEINRKVEQYVNKSKKFPDYYSVHYLVKRANLKHNLMLSESQQQSIARTVFTEVGEAIQHRRKSDYLLNRGSYLTEKIDELTDPASIDPKLEEKLAENSKRARTQLNSVLEKYSRKQVDIE
uniref:Daxx histone-binding domain-containing protein n=1 Tax=Ciona savignyi TaxID=51511 RepID=H2YCA3_CIOSA